MGCISSTRKHVAVEKVDKDNTQRPEDENASLVGSDRAPKLSRSKSKQGLSQNIVIENVDRDIRDYYDIDKQPVLGSGISGSVRTCVHKETNTKFALKTLSKRKLKPEKLQRLKEEIQFMIDLDHPNILRLHEYFETNDVIYLVLELCRGGELLDRLHEQKGHHYSEKVACRYVHTMLSAISYCHAHNIVHRDLKLENFLFEDESPNSELKLIDFGLSHYFAPDEVLHNAVGTPYYVAPEVLLGNYNAKCDVWSIGVIAFMLLSGTPPFYGKTDADTLQSVKLGRWRFDDVLFRPVSTNAKNFITACLTRRVSSRPSGAEALKHPWFNLLKSEAGSNNVPLSIIERLEVFVKRSSLAKICMEVVAHTLQPQQIADLRAEFLKIDSSQTGEISIADFRRVLLENRMEEAEIGRIFEGVDVDHLGKISYHEFLAATISRKSITEENIKVAFEKMSNHNEFITCLDIKELLGEDASVDEVESMLAEVNLPPDTKISLPDFKRIMIGGYTSPIQRSPFNHHRNKIAFFTDGSGGESPSRFSPMKNGDSHATGASSLKILESIREDDEGRRNGESHSPLMISMGDKQT